MPDIKNALLIVSDDKEDVYMVSVRDDGCPTIEVALVNGDAVLFPIDRDLAGELGPILTMFSKTGECPVVLPETEAADLAEECLECLCGLFNDREYLRNELADASAERTRVSD